ncbi:MAG: protease modulator HflC [Pseudomonadales bacterium]|nr:protease modulator HflC [Pseudomonadales bacterium]
MNPKTIVILLVIGVATLIGGQTLYMVNETQRAVLLEFGKMTEADIPPGLHIKFPLINEVKRFDARVLTVDARPEQYFTKEKKALIVDSFAMYRISNVEKYYTATSGDSFQAGQLLAQRINTGLRNQFGERTMHEVVSGEREQLMEELRHQLEGSIKDELGVDLIDIRVKRIDLPEDVSHSVHDRMNSERERLAREARSQGQEQAEFIKAKADRERTIIEADAYEQSEKIRGEGDAEATRIYASAFNKDVEFYKFYRSLNAYKDTFQSKSDILLLDQKGDFFKYMNNIKGD